MKNIILLGIKSISNMYDTSEIDKNATGVDRINYKNLRNLYQKSTGQSVSSFNPYFNDKELINNLINENNKLKGESKC